MNTTKVGLAHLASHKNTRASSVTLYLLSIHLKLENWRKCRVRGVRLQSLQTYQLQLLILGGPTVVTVHQVQILKLGASDYSHCKLQLQQAVTPTGNWIMGSIFSVSFVMTKEMQWHTHFIQNTEISVPLSYSVCSTGWPLCQFKNIYEEHISL